MSNLRDAIRLEIERGNLREPFTVQEVQRLAKRNGGKLSGSTYTAKSIGEILPNHSTGPGYRQGQSVKHGGAKLFLKHSQRATYSIKYSTYDEETDESYEQTPIGKPSTAPAIDAILRTKTAKGGKRHLVQNAFTKQEIADRFVYYLRNKPFRLLLNTRNGMAWGPPPVIGWLNRVNRYEWKGLGWAATSKILREFIADLATLNLSARNLRIRGAEALRIYNAIKRWGNPKGVKRKGADILGFLRDLWATGQIKEVDSTLTKLYALARPTTYVIFDSRVAAAIVTIAEDLFRRRTSGKRVVDTVAEFQKEFPALGLYNGTGGTRQRGYRSNNWPNAYANIDAQRQANTLCELIVKRLNEIAEDGRKDWSMREVEAVLFMEGY